MNRQHFLLPHELRFLQHVIFPIALILLLLAAFAAGIYYANLVTQTPMDSFMDSALYYLKAGLGA